MATIIQREAQGAPSGYDQGLLLEYKEAFLYPLPTGLLDWNELRIGFRVGLYPITGDWRTGSIATWPFTFHDHTRNRTSSTPGELKIGKMFFGLKNSNNYLMPLESGDSRYIGFGQHSGDLGVGLETNTNNTTLGPRTLYWDSANSLIQQSTMLVASGNTLGSRATVFRLNSAASNGAFPFCSPMETATSGRYSEMFALRYTKIGGTGLNFAIWKNFDSDNQASPGVTYTSTNTLRSFINSINASDTNKYVNFTNFFYNNSGTQSGSAIPLPDAIFAYLSMTGLRLIIYDMIAEKIS